MRDKETNTKMHARLTRRSRLGRRGAGILAAIIAGTLSLPAVAVAQEPQITAFDGAVTANPGGDAYTQAGGHPYDISTDIAFSETPDPTLSLPIADGDPKTIKVDLPPGLIGNPSAMPLCEPEEFFDADLLENRCPTESQVGTAMVNSQGFQQWLPLYNLRPGTAEVPAQFGFTLGAVPIILNATVRSGDDYGITITVPEINQGVMINSTRVTLWGVPASPEHDGQRCKVIEQRGGSGPYGCWTDASDPRKQPQSVSVRPIPLITLPTTCTEPGVGLETRLAVEFWDAPGQFRTASFISHLPPGYPSDPSAWGPPQGPDGCNAMPFEPTISATPTSSIAGKPTGLEVRLQVPQAGFLSPNGLATAHLKTVKLTLPEGMSISPAGADGLKACSDSQIGFGNNDVPTCPEASKIGTVSIDTPVLREPLVGSVFIAEPRPGQIFRLSLVARAPGVTVKLRGDVSPDPRTGQIVTSFDNNPQVPFSELTLRLKDGPRAPLTNPTSCGTYTNNAQMTSWSGKVADSSSSFTLIGDGGSCAPRGFTPAFGAGLANPIGGSSSPFTLTLSRDDDDQYLSSVAVDMPEGLTGVIASTTLCADAQAASGTCGEESRIGSTITGAGSGPQPLFIPGRVYLTGPYKGAPYGLSIVVPAIAGPFDLGTVVVRAAIWVDRTTARLSVVSDPLPTILEGVPLLLRKVIIAIDKPGFMVAPTSCSPKRVDARIGSTAGASAAVGSRFQAAGCRGLDYAPKMTFSIGDRTHLRGGSTTPLAVTLRMPPGNANNQSIEVTLPDNINSRLAALRGACSVENARARACGREAIVGSAVATTPLLKNPLRGPVYILRTPGNRLPDLWVALRGNDGDARGLEIDLIGKVRIVGRKFLLRTTFGTIPDVPVTMFRLNFVSGRQAPIGIIRGLCSAEVRRGLVGRLAMRAQNGSFIRRHQKMQVAGCRASRRRASTRGKKQGRK